MVELKFCSCCRRKYNIDNFKKPNKTKIYKTCSYCRKIRNYKKHKTITIEYGEWHIDWAGYGKITRIK